MWPIREPDLVIYRGSERYMERWFLLPRNKYFNVYLQHGVLSDYLTPHDHPWWNISFILKNSYYESQYFVYDKKLHLLLAKERKQFRIIYRSATQLHRIELIRGKPFWSLFITGPAKRDWGFQTRNGWVSHQAVLDIDRMKGTSKIKPQFQDGWR